MRTFTLTFGALLTLLPVLRAGERVEVPWYDMCRAAQGNEINIKTATGENIDGYCVSVQVDEMNLRTVDGKVVTLARSALHRVRMHRAPSHQLRALGHGMHDALHEGFEFLFSPMAPMGLVAVPGTLAWGAVSAPFCLLRDLHDKLRGAWEVKLI